MTDKQKALINTLLLEKNVPESVFHQKNVYIKINNKVSPFNSGNGFLNKTYVKRGEAADIIDSIKADNFQIVKISPLK